MRFTGCVGDGTRVNRTTSLVIVPALLAVCAGPLAPLLSCATSSRSASGFLAVKPQALPSAGSERARVITDELLVQFETTSAGPVAVSTYQRQTQILSQLEEKRTELTASYQATFERLERFDARVIDEKGGTVKAWSLKDAVDAPEFPDFVLYADSRVAIIKVPC